MKINDVFKKAQEEIERVNEFDKYLRDNLEELEKLEAFLSPVSGWLIHTTFDYSGRSIDLHYSGDKFVLQGIFAALRKADYEPSSRPQKDELSSFSTYFSKADAPRLWISFSSTKCRRVQVGTKMVEQPVYETVCD